VRRYIKLLAVLSVVAIAAAACGGGGGTTGTSPGGKTSGAKLQPGGTLRVATPADISGGWDPAKEYEAIAWELYRCCLTRTMLSYKGIEGAPGSVIYPDLATGTPTVSSDQLTWTFKIKPGIHYAPPFQDTEITAQDFITALGRLSSPEGSAGGYSFYFSSIKGFDQAKGDPTKITGVSAPDPHTLQVQLTEPTGDLGYRFATPATAPVPAEAAKGHIKDYGRFLVSSGPYMFEGSDTLNFKQAPASQKPVAGYQPNRSWIFVRNPTWQKEKATDSLRGKNAFVDRIEVAIGGEEADLDNKIEADAIDVCYGCAPVPQTIQKFETDPNLKDQIHSNPADAFRYLAMNMAIPPFDDLHVRKAMSYIVDKDGLRRARGGPITGDIAGHLIPDSLEGDQLKGFDPYATPNSAGDLTKAKNEMKQSKYDTNKDGICDASECKNVLMIADSSPPYPDQNAVLQDNAGKIGISFDVKSGDRYTFMYAKCQDPNAHAAFCPSPGWAKDYPDASTFGIPLFSSAGIGSSDYSLLGASPALLKKAGYSVTSVPSVDDKVKQCNGQVGDQRIACWANLDKFLMTDVVPVIPWLFDFTVNIISSRVLNFTYDQDGSEIAFDHLALAGGGA
jgi:peptide/nickel transport system substrate-binding protein